MAGILDLINSPIGQTVMQGLSQETNESPSKTSSVLNLALPVLLSAMKKMLLRHKEQKAYLMH